MLIKPLDEVNKYDIFLGKGWENWVRVHVKSDEVEIMNKSPSVEITKKLLDLIFYKVRRYKRGS